MRWSARFSASCLVLVLAACGDDDDSGESDAGDELPVLPSGSLLVLTYNVAGLPEGLSQSMPLRNTPMIGPKLNAYDLVFLQESWQTPDPNPVAPLRGYHEILVASADHAYKTPAAPQPLGSDPERPTALLSDGLAIFSRIPLGETRRVAWQGCVETASDCLAFKGFSMTPAELAAGVPVHLYDLHMEAGDSAADDTARGAGIEQLAEFIAENSKDMALIVAGDFNLNTDAEPASQQLAQLLQLAGLSDACSELDCQFPGSIDKVLFRSSAAATLRAQSWQREDSVFVSDSGQPLSDHDPVAVRLDWSAKPDP